jgi:5-methylcytosine-specific restriction endonuclease McrA
MKQIKKRYLSDSERHEVYRREDGICQTCGRAASFRREFDRRLVGLVHHKDKNRENNVLDNLEWVCFSCHAKIHNKGNKRRLYNEITKKRQRATSL